MSKQPNIIIFNPDHMRGDMLGHLGNPAAVTPCLDNIVKNEGISFRNAFCQNGVCTPSRCSFMSGWYPHVRGHRTMYHMMHEDEPVLLRTLKKAGYYVWWGGKNDIAPAQYGYQQFCHTRYHGLQAQNNPDEDQWHGAYGHDGYYSMYYGRIDVKPDNIFTDHDWDIVRTAIRFIRSKPPEPFCLFLALHNPHPPYAVEDPWYSMIDRTKLPERIKPPEDLHRKSSILGKMFERYGLGRWNEKRWDELRATSYGMCSRLDHQLGLLIDALKDEKLYDDSALFFFSDHGDYLGDYGVVDINQNTFEDSLIRVPFIIKPPAGTSVHPGIRNALVELIDFPATVHDLLNISYSHTQFGQTLMPLLSRNNDKHRDAVFCEGGRLHGEGHCMELQNPCHENPQSIWWPRVGLQSSEGPEHTKAVMCRTQDYKFVRRLYEDDELYDLKSDPQECCNLIKNPDFSNIILKMKDRLLTFLLETSDVVPHTADSRGYEMKERDLVDYKAKNFKVVVASIFKHIFFLHPLFFFYLM